MNKKLYILFSLSIVLNIIFIGFLIAIYSAPVCWEYDYGEDGNYIFICEKGGR